MGSVSPLARLLFIGLLTLADREGCLEDKPKQIEVQLFPYDKKVKVDSLLKSLSGHFLTRHDVNGIKFIKITNFSKHQRVNPKEPPSKFAHLLAGGVNLDSGGVNLDSVFSGSGSGSGSGSTTKSKPTHPIAREDSDSSDEGEATDPPPPTIDDQPEPPPPELTFDPTLREPCPEEVRQAALLIGYAIPDPQRFIDHYRVTGWEIRAGVFAKDWRPLLGRWKTNEASRSQAPPGKRSSHFMSPTEQTIANGKKLIAEAQERERREKQRGVENSDVAGVKVSDAQLLP